MIKTVWLLLFVFLLVSCKTRTFTERYFIGPPTNTLIILNSQKNTFYVRYFFHNYFFYSRGNYSHSRDSLKLSSNHDRNIFKLIINEMQNIEISDNEKLIIAKDLRKNDKSSNRIEPCNYNLILVLNDTAEIKISDSIRYVGELNSIEIKAVYPRNKECIQNSIEFTSNAYKLQRSSNLILIDYEINEYEMYFFRNYNKAFKIGKKALILTEDSTTVFKEYQRKTIEKNFIPLLKPDEILN